MLCAQRRRHYVLHAFDTGPLGIGLVEQEVRQHRFHMDLHATRLRGERRMQRFLTRQMDHIASGSRIFKECCEVARAFSFDRFGTAGFVPFGAGPPFREQFLLQTGYEFRVFTVRGDNHSEALGEFEGLVHFGVIDAKKVLVGEKEFERRRAVGDNLSQLRFRFLHKLGYRHVKGVVTRALSVGLRFPELIAFQRIVVAIGAAHFNVGCRSTYERSDATGFVRVFGKGRHERKIDVYVRIDETGKNKFAGGVDDFRVRRSLDIFAYACDSFVFDVDIRLDPRAHGHNFAISDQQGHLSLPQRVTSSSVNMDSHLLAIFLHLLPVLGYFALRLSELAPGNRWPPGRFFNHVNTVFDGTHVIAEAAANTILLAHVNAGTRVHGFFLAVRLNVIRLRLDYAAVLSDKVDALVGGVVTGDVAKIATDAFLLVDSCDSTKRTVKMIEIGHAVQAACYHVGDSCEAFFVHPVGQAIAQVFHNAETIVHYRGADLQGAGAEQQKFRRIAPRRNASHSRDGQLGTTHDRILSKRRQHI